ncbi:MAG: two-component system, cell cycle response regulator DivK [Betaproteobacteria bacterium]|jgi:CheY-like chemotaxis protein
MQILVVDDEPDIRDTMKVLLQMKGHSVDLAANGKQAVEIATERLPDVVFMDLKMPVMDGLTATQLLRAGARTSEVPIICISAYLQQDDWRVQALAAGCNECLSKPVDIGRLDLMLSRFHPPY